MKSLPSFGSPSLSVLNPWRGGVTHPELDPEHSPESNSLWPTWAKTKGTQSLRSTTVHVGTELGPEGPDQGVRRNGEAVYAPRDSFLTVDTTVALANKLATTIPAIPPKHRDHPCVPSLRRPWH